MDDVWVSFGKAAEVIGCSVGRVQRMTKDGEIIQRDGPRGQPSLSLASVLEARERDRVAAARRRTEKARRSGPPDHEHEWLRSIEVAERLGVSRSRVDALVRQGRLPFTRHGRRRWFRSEHVEVFANARDFREQMRRTPDK